jgi:hypothetical protein
MHDFNYCQMVLQEKLSGVNLNGLAEISFS